MTLNYDNYQSHEYMESASLSPNPNQPNQKFHQQFYQQLQQTSSILSNTVYYANADSSSLYNIQLGDPDNALSVADSNMQLFGSIALDDTTTKNTDFEMAQPVMESPISSSSSSSLFEINALSPMLSSEFPNKDKFEKFDDTMVPSFEDYSATYNLSSQIAPPHHTGPAPPQSRDKEFFNLESFHDYSTEGGDYDNIRTINTAELTKPFSIRSNSPVLKSQALLSDDVFSFTQLAMTADPAALVSGPSTAKMSLSPEIDSTNETVAESGVSQVENLELLDAAESQELSPANSTMNAGFNDGELLNISQRKKEKLKKISDSRLSLSQLSFVLNLANDIQETARREKNILTILREDLQFPLGEKTWIRDTPQGERVVLIDKLWQLVEQKYQYGYSRDILSIVVRRASYYLMQGRLRRERRMEKKKNGVLPWKRKNSKV